MLDLCLRPNLVALCLGYRNYAGVYIKGKEKKDKDYRFKERRRDVEAQGLRDQKSVQPDSSGGRSGALAAVKILGWYLIGSNIVDRC